MSNQDSESGSNPSDNSSRSIFGNGTSSQQAYSADQVPTTPVQTSTSTIFAAAPLNGSNRLPHNRVIGHVPQARNTFLNLPIFSLPAELWADIIGGLDLPALALFLEALHFHFPPLGVYPPAGIRLLPPPPNGLINRYPHEILDHIFQHLDLLGRMNFVLAHYRHLPQTKIKHASHSHSTQE